MGLDLYLLAIDGVDLFPSLYDNSVPFIDVNKSTHKGDFSLCGFHGANGIAVFIVSIYDFVYITFIGH